MSRILIVEDEQKIARFIKLELEYEGYEAVTCGDGREGLDLALKERFDLIILDIMLPTLSGIEVLRRLRNNSQVPVIILTARDQVIDKVNGLDVGADDYMTKPFAIEELLARIRVLLKRRQEDSAAELRYLNVGRLRIGTDEHAVTFDGHTVELTKKEYDLLVYLALNKNIVMTREKILDAVWGYDFYGDTNVVDVYIRYLRSKIDDRFGAKLIHTLRGTGYLIKE